MPFATETEYAEGLARFNQKKAERNERRRIAYREKKEREGMAQTTALLNGTTLPVNPIVVHQLGNGRTLTMIPRARARVSMREAWNNATREATALQMMEFATINRPILTPGTYNENADVPDGMPPRAEAPVLSAELQQSSRESAQRVIDAMNALDIGARRRTVDDVLRDRATAILAEQAQLRAEREAREASKIKLLPTFISNELIETAKSAGKQWECIICCNEKCPSTYKFRACGHRQCGECFIKCGAKCPECRS